MYACLTRDNESKARMHTGRLPPSMKRHADSQNILEFGVPASNRPAQQVLSAEPPTPTAPFLAAQPNSMLTTSHNDGVWSGCLHAIRNLSVIKLAHVHASAVCTAHSMTPIASDTTSARNTDTSEPHQHFSPEAAELLLHTISPVMIKSNKQPCCC